MTLSCNPRILLRRMMTRIRARSLMKATRMRLDPDHRQIAWELLGAMSYIQQRNEHAARPAIAGPPCVSDDPEPTPYRQFKIYNTTSPVAPSQLNRTSIAWHRT